jgi:hypothetical protein
MGIMLLPVVKKFSRTLKRAGGVLRLVADED